MAKKVTDKLLIVFIDSPLPTDERTDGVSGELDSTESLLHHVKEVAMRVDAKRHLYYSNVIDENDNWPKTHFIKYLQCNGDVGEQLKGAFQNGFKKGYGRIVCVGVCCEDLMPDDIQKAFDMLNSKQAVIGPSDNGGYYLIGLSSPIESIFEDKPWGTDAVFKKTYLELLMYNKRIGLLEEKQLINSRESNSSIDLN